MRVACRDRSGRTAHGCGALPVDHPAADAPSGSRALKVAHGCALPRSERRRTVARLRVACRDRRGEADGVTYRDGGDHRKRDGARLRVACRDRSRGTAHRPRRRRYRSARRTGTGRRHGAQDAPQTAQDAPQTAQDAPQTAQERAAHRDRPTARRTAWTRHRPRTAARRRSGARHRRRAVARLRVGCACRDRNGQADGVTYRDGRRTVARRSSGGRTGREVHTP